MNCCVPSCKTDAVEGYSVPICDMHGRQVAQRYKAEIVYQARRESSPEATAARKAAGRKQSGNGEGGLVYYVRMRDGLIKIGYTTRLRTRLRDLRTDPARDLLAIEFGKPELERIRHRDFIAERTGLREEFHPSDRLMKWIADQRAATALPKWVNDPDTRTVRRLHL